MMNKAELKKKVYRTFTSRNMVILAICALIIFFAELYTLSKPAALILSFFNGLIWLAFLSEFALKIYVEKGSMDYIDSHKLDSAISTIIIVVPVLSYLANLYFASSPIVGVLRLSGALRPSTLASAGAYAAKAGTKTDDVKL